MHVGVDEARQSVAALAVESRPGIQALGRGRDNVTIQDADAARLDAAGIDVDNLHVADRKVQRSLAKRGFDQSFALLRSQRLQGYPPLSYGWRSTRRQIWNRKYSGMM